MRLNELKRQVRDRLSDDRKRQLCDHLDTGLDHALDGLVWFVFSVDAGMERLGRAARMMWQSFHEGWYGPGYDQADEVRDMESQDV